MMRRHSHIQTRKHVRRAFVRESKHEERCVGMYVPSNRTYRQGYLERVQLVNDSVRWSIASYAIFTLHVLPRSSIELSAREWIDHLRVSRAFVHVDIRARNTGEERNEEWTLAHAAKERERRVSFTESDISYTFSAPLSCVFYAWEAVWKFYE